MQIDERFLSPHPATVVWWAQRQQCNTCAHMALAEGHDGEGVMRCTATPLEHSYRGVSRMHEVRGILAAYCIDARQAKQPCGPDAQLWKAK